MVQGLIYCLLEVNPSTISSVMNNGEEMCGVLSSRSHLGACFKQSQLPGEHTAFCAACVALKCYGTLQQSFWPRCSFCCEYIYMITQFKLIRQWSICSTMKEVRLKKRIFQTMQHLLIMVSGNPGLRKYPNKSLKNSHNKMSKYWCDMSCWFSDISHFVNHKSWWCH